MKYTEPERGDYARSALYIVVYLAVIGGGAFLLLPRWWYLWALMVLGGLVLLVGWHRGMTAYQCPNCGHVYEISFWKDLAAPHGVDTHGGWLLLRCPNCGERHKTHVLKRVE